MEQEKGTSIDQECIAFDAATAHHLIDNLAAEAGIRMDDWSQRLVNFHARRDWERNWNSLYGGKIQSVHVRRRGNHGQ